jgi:DNA-binding transcriptional regulator YiaG
MASGEDLAALDESLRENGQQDPIDVTPDGTILDGRTRWTLLQKQGATTIQVRVVDYPEAQQTAYIIDRALSRRHLTMEQKQALNALMATHIIEEVENPRTGEVMRIGLGQTQRAEKLGVTRETVRQWDEDQSARNLADQPAPTHFVRGGGNPTPYPMHPKASGPSSDKPSRRDEKRSRVAKANATHRAPRWMAQFRMWVRRTRREDRKYLESMQALVTEALGRID